MREFDHLTAAERCELLTRMSTDFGRYVEWGDKCPRSQSYRIDVPAPGPRLSHERRRRLEGLKGSPGLTKMAFDTRRMNQETERNPRKNLQHWHRADPFVTSEDKVKLERFARLFQAVAEVRRLFEGQPEWPDSYARVLHDALDRTLQTKQGSIEVFRPQFNYLEQLLFTRYRLSMEDLGNLKEADLTTRVLGKDEDLLKRGDFLKQTSGLAKNAPAAAPVAVAAAPVVAPAPAPDHAAQALASLFSLSDRPEIGRRTITITISDEPIEVK